MTSTTKHDAPLVSNDTVTNDDVSALMRSFASFDQEQFSAFLKANQKANDTGVFLAGVYHYLSQRNHPALRRHLNNHKQLEPSYLMDLREACVSLQQGNTAQVLEQVKALTAWPDLNPILLIILAEAQYLCCDFTQAHHNFAKACRLVRSSEQLEILARKCLHQIEALRYSDSLAEGAMAYLLDNRFDSSNISTLVSSLLRHKYRLDAPDSEAVTIELVDLLNDRFLHEALKQLVLSDKSLELFLINLRKSLLSMVVDGGQLPVQLLPFLSAFSEQCWMNEYVFYVDDNEKQACVAIEQLVSELLNEEQVSLEVVSGLVLILALFDPLSESSVYSQLTELPLSSWPKVVQSCFAKIIYQEQQELALAEQLKSITPIREGVSEVVRTQYEQNPYPRWSDIDRLPVKDGFLKNFQMHKPPYTKLKFLGKPLKMLVAGCGTGREAIGLALAFPEIEVTAVDLSRRSLAYASLKAQEIGVSNISFFHGDILELGTLKDRFHIIQCAGVLHHMEDPEAGLKILRGLLVKQGIIKLAFYSRTARQQIDLFRANHELESSREGIRRLRKDMLDSSGSEYATILELADFYTTSMCRDLLFHVQEHCVDLPHLDNLLSNNQLAFRGFSVANPIVFQGFQRSPFFKSAESYFDLQAWHRFEIENPITFIGMYQFFAQAV